jgi:hypothetical protein
MAAPQCPGHPDDIRQLGRRRDRIAQRNNLIHAVTPIGGDPVRAGAEIAAAKYGRTAFECANEDELEYTLGGMVYL